MNPRVQLFMCNINMLVAEIATWEHSLGNSLVHQNYHLTYPMPSISNEYVLQIAQVALGWGWAAT